MKPRRHHYRNYFLLLQVFTLVRTLEIKNVWTPDVIENGTQKSALVDCDYTYDERDIQSLEVKWYFRHDPAPIYTWVPPNQPQVVEAFANHVNLNYEISSDPYFKHRALNLQGLSTKLSGRYSCRVSSIYSDEFQSKDLIIYAPTRKRFLEVGWVSQNDLNVTCTAMEVYPEPLIRILINAPPFLDHSVDISDEASRSVVWSDGSFSATMSKSIIFMDGSPMLEMMGTPQDDHLGRIVNKGETMPTVTCELSLAGTPYHEVLWAKIPKVPTEFQSGTKDKDGDEVTASSGSGLLKIVFFMFLNTFIVVVVQSLS